MAVACDKAANMRPILPTDSLLAENIRLKQQLSDVETGDLTIAVQECAELRDQRDALTLRLQASEQDRFALKAQVRRVREALDESERWAATRKQPTMGGE